MHTKPLTVQAMALENHFSVEAVLFSIIFLCWIYQEESLSLGLASVKGLTLPNLPF